MTLGTTTLSCEAVFHSKREDPVFPAGKGWWCLTKTLVRILFHCHTPEKKKYCSVYPHRSRMPLLSASHGPFFVYSSSKAQEIASQVGLKHFGQGTEPCSCTVLQRHWLSSGIPFCWSSSSSVRKLVFQLCPSEPCEDLMRARIRFRFFDFSPIQDCPCLLQSLHIFLYWHSSTTHLTH